MHRRLAGVAVESQDYRALMRAAILAFDPTASIIDPGKVVPEQLAPSLHPPGTLTASYWERDSSVRQAFGACVELAAAADVVVSYLPSASMGSAVELHAARAAGRLILVIAPGKMRGNWVVRSYADEIFEDIPALQAWLAGRAGPPLAKRRAAGAPPSELRGAITFLYSDDLQKSRRFYGEDLALALRSDKGEVLFYALPGGGGGNLGLVQAGVSAAARPPCSATTAGRDVVVLCLLTDDVDTVFARLVARSDVTWRAPMHMVLSMAFH